MPWLYVIQIVPAQDTAVALSLPKCQYTLSPAAWSAITAAAPLACDVIDTLM